jgi:hypothetical protein
MARAFKFLKSTSVNSGAAFAEGSGVVAEVSGGVVLTGDAVGETPPIGAVGGDSSWAVTSEAAQTESNEAKKRRNAIMAAYSNEAAAVCDV